jgi:hypothetical protein
MLQGALICYPVVKHKDERMHKDDASKLRFMSLKRRENEKAASNITDIYACLGCAYGL